PHHCRHSSAREPRHARGQESASIFLRLLFPQLYPDNVFRRQSWLGSGNHQAGLLVRPKMKLQASLKLPDREFWGIRFHILTTTPSDTSRRTVEHEMRLRRKRVRVRFEE